MRLIDPGRLENIILRQLAVGRFNPEPLVDLATRLGLEVDECRRAVVNLAKRRALRLVIHPGALYELQGTSASYSASR